MIMNFNTAPAAPARTASAAPASAPAPAPAAASAPAPSQAAASPGTPGYGSTAPSALPLFAQVLDVTGGETADAGTPAPAPAKDGDTDDQADNGLPAMAAPVIGLPVTMLPPTDAAAAEARVAAQTQAQTSAQTSAQANVAQMNVAQANPALNISLHPAAITITAQGTAQPAGRDTREPLAAANPAAPAKGGAPAQPFESLPQQGAPATAAIAAPVAPAAREGERGAATPAPAAPNLGLTGAIGNTATAAQPGDTIKLNGPAQQWQEPLREALGERLQTQIGRNSEHATIRLEPPMLGRIEISIRHTAGALQVNVTASNSEVLRQLQGIGENMRSDLAQRQYTDVAVNISATPRSPAAQAFAEGDARGQRQPGRQHDDAEPGRALSDGSTAATTYAMHERESA